MQIRRYTRGIDHVTTFTAEKGKRADISSEKDGEAAGELTEQS